MSRITRLWADFEKKLFETNPTKLVGLNPPATEAAIANLELQLGVPLPSEFKESLRIHDGGTYRNQILDGEELLAIPRIAEEWRHWNQLLKSPGLKVGGHRSNPEPGVKTDWWNPLWIPITSNHAGDHWCLDLDPAPGGTRGQVIRMWHNRDTREIGGADFASFLASF